MTYAIKNALADFLKWIGWRCVRLADRLDGEQPRERES